MGALGAPRATVDLDFLIHRDDLKALDQIMTGLGYLSYARTENVSHYRHPQGRWGAVDVLHAFRHFSLGMLERAASLPIFGGARTIRVLQPEDIIGLKVQVMANNPLRRAQETVDIEALLAVYGRRLDWNRVQEYFDLFELGAETRRLRERFGHAE